MDSDNQHKKLNEITKIIQIQCIICKGVGLIKREKVSCKICNDLYCKGCDLYNTLTLPPYYECVTCDGLGYNPLLEKV